MRESIQVGEDPSSGSEKARESEMGGSWLTRGQRWLERTMKRAFQGWGELVGRHPWPFVIGPLLVSAILSPFYLLSVFSTPDTIRNEHIIKGSPSWKEWQVAREFFASEGERLYVKFLVEAKDRGSLMRQGHLEELIRLKDQVLDELSVEVEGRNFTYRDLCAPHCSESVPVSQFLSLRRDNSTFIRYTFPSFALKVRSYKAEAYLGYNVYGAQTDGLGELDGFRLLTLNLIGTLDTPLLQMAGRAWMWEAQRQTAAMRETNALLDPYVGSHDLVAAEANKSGRQGTIFIPLVVTVLVIFCVLNFVRSNRLESKPAEALAAVGTPLAAIGTAFGLLICLGWPLGVMSANAPFVILAIGVDDAFLMLHSLRSVSRSRYSVEERVGRALAHIGPSISITSLTNAVSFGVGAATNSDMIKGFSVFTAVAVAVDFAFQLSLFLGVLVLGARREKAGTNLCGCGQERDAGPALPQSSAKPPLTRQASVVATRFRLGLRVYVDFLLSAKGLALGLLLFLAYFAAAAFGFSQIRPALTDERMFLPDSYYRRVMQAYESMVVKEGDFAAVIVDRPGDLRNESRLERFFQFVDELEGGPGMIGAASRDLFLDEFLPFVGFERSVRSERLFCPYSLESFFSKGTQKRWRHYVRLSEEHCRGQNTSRYRDDHDCLEADPKCLDKFFFYTSFKAPGGQKAERVEEWRRVAGRYEDFGVTVWSEMNFYGDQLLELPWISLTTVGTALGFMCLVCAVFVPSLPSVAVAVVAMLSINLGVMAGLHYLGSDMNIVTIGTMLMTIGFSVDFVAHISYHYFSSGAEERDARLSLAFHQMDQAKAKRHSAHSTDSALRAQPVHPVHPALPAKETELGRGWSGALSSPPSSEGSEAGWGGCLGSASAGQGGSEAAFWRVYSALDGILVPTLQAGASTVLTAAVLPIIVGGFILMEFLKSICLVVSIGLLHALFFLPTFLPRLRCF